MADRAQRGQRLAAGTLTLINQKALSCLLDLLQLWLPDGRQKGSEWIARNPRRTDHHPGSFKINVRTGAWADFATGDKGGDVISLQAYLRDLPQSEAARLLAVELRTPTTIKPKTPSASLTAGGGRAISPPVRLQTCKRWAARSRITPVLRACRWNF